MFAGSPKSLLRRLIPAKMRPGTAILFKHLDLIIKERMIFQITKKQPKELKVLNQFLP
jgi:hypothetical protein